MKEWGRGFEHQQRYTNYYIQEQQSVRNASTTSSTTKPFKILGLQQIAIGSTDANAMNKLWIDILGLEKVGSYTSEKENVAEDILQLGNTNNSSVPVEVDLMCPLDEDRSPKVDIDAIS